jgi:long-chain acyl-CoA synthetase
MNRFAELISRAGWQFGGKTAVICDEVRLSFAETEAASNRLASALVTSLGLRKGDRVGVFLSNCPEYVVTDLALLKAGLVRVQINPRFTAAEAEFIVNHSGARLLVTSAEHAAVAAAVAEKAPQLQHVLAAQGTVPTRNAISWQEALSAGEAKPFAVDTTLDDGYMLGYTSGTTGRPKGAFTTLRSRWAMLLQVYANETHCAQTDVMAHAASLAHGSGTKMLPHYIKGAANLLLRKFSAEAFFQAVQAHRVTTSWMVPTMVAMLVQSPARSRFDLSSLHTIIYGGAAMPDALIAQALEAFGPIFIQMYGLNEAPHPDLTLSKADHLPDPATGRPRRPGVTGRPSVGPSVRVVNEAGREVAPGEIGEIVIAGEHVMVGYWNDPQASAETLRDGWCHTGDLARVDDEGCVYIVDRKKEMIISGGYNVYPREVEEVLYRHPDVRECAVIGEADAHWGEAVIAVVSLKPGASADPASLAAHCAEFLAGYKKPRRIEIVEELPKTAAGKIDKKAIRAARAARVAEAASQ